MRDAKSCIDKDARGGVQSREAMSHAQRKSHQRNYKKEALMEQRFTEIERENRILLEKMTSIMKNGGRPGTTKSLCKLII